MRIEEYRALVERGSAEAARSPRLHRLRILGLILLGYAYLLGVLSLMVAGLGWTLHAWYAGELNLGAAGYPVALAIIVMFAGVRAFLAATRRPKLDGVTIEPRDAPVLFAEIEQVRQRLLAPILHEVIIDSRFNAGIGHIPRPLLGLLGSSRRCLVLGLPFLDAHDIVQFRATLAHELAHAAGGHTRFHAWTYGVRATWIALLESRDVRDAEWSELVFTRFFRWFAPRFLAHTFVLARAHEYAADAMSAGLVGRSTAASALVRNEVLARFYDHFVARALESARFEPEPPVSAFESFAEVAIVGPPADLAKQFHAQAFAASSDLDDVHPCLADRLHALDVDKHDDIDWVTVAPTSAARTLLGDAALARVRGELGARWLKEVRPAWEERRRRLGEAQSVAQALDARIAAGDVLTFDERRALLTSHVTVDGLLESKQIVEAFVTDYPASVGARLLFAELLLVHDKDDAGLAQLHAAMSLDPTVVPAACWLAHAYLASCGRQEEAETYRARVAADARDADLFATERREVRASDTFLPHGLPPDVVKTLERALLRVPKLLTAFLVRKTVTCRPEYPCFVLALEPIHRSVEDRRALETRLVGSARALTLPEGTLVCVFDSLPRASREAIQRVDGARVLAP